MNEIILFYFYEDVDECKTNTHTCDKNALCMNQWGGYKCRCNDGYEEHNSGRICSKKGEILRHVCRHPIFLKQSVPTIVPAQLGREKNTRKDLTTLKLRVKPRKTQVKLPDESFTCVVQVVE